MTYTDPQSAAMAWAKANDRSPAEVIAEHGTWASFAARLMARNEIQLTPQGWVIDRGQTR